MVGYSQLSQVQKATTPVAVGVGVGVGGLSILSSQHVMCDKDTVLTQWKVRIIMLDHF